MPKLPILGSFGGTGKGRGSKDGNKLSVARIIKTVVCVIAFLGVMAGFSFLCRELVGNYLLLVLPQASLTANWLARLAIWVVCLAVTINIMAVLVRPVWLAITAYFLAAIIYVLIIGASEAMLVIAVIFFAGLSSRLMFVVRQLNNQINFSIHPLSDKNNVFFALLALLVASTFWLGYSQDMAKRAFIIAPEIKSVIVDLSVSQTKGLIKKQKLPLAQEKMAITAASQKVQEMIEGFEKPLAPFSRFVPIIFAAILFSFLMTVFLFLGIVSLLVLKILFALMRLAHFTSFTVENREIKHLIL